MKYLLLLAVLGFFLSLLVYLRMRPYLPVVRQFFQVWRALRGGAARTAPGRTTTIPGRTAQPAERLTRCATCGTWTPPAQAVKLGPQSFCSHECLEKASTRQG